MDNAHVQVTYWWRNSPPHGSDESLWLPILNLIYLWRTGLGRNAKNNSGWSDYSPILGLPIGLMYAACLPPASLSHSLNCVIYINSSREQFSNVATARSLIMAVLIFLAVCWVVLLSVCLLPGHFCCAGGVNVLAGYV